ncbi:MAG: cytochrome P450, partial [Kutzneria sp.]|nr:cytochrome P450 [Kutzneria sp.]
MLLLARDADTGEGMSDQQVYDEVVTLLTGGIEPGGLALSWFFHEVARDRRIEQRLHAEVDEVLSGREVTADDVPKLVYTRQIAHEVLRCYPIWLLMRRTCAEVELGGVRLPPGTEVTLSPHALHHDPRTFPDPDRFDPDRFTPDRISALPKGAYVPFSAGVHQCIGNVFALTEITVAAATLAARWRLVPVAGKPVHQKVTGAAYPSQLPMTVEPRTA